ncbi:MAG: sensor histidine kinase, partial [Bacteroidia bacterium]
NDGISKTSKILRFLTVSGVSYAFDLQTKKNYVFNQTTFELKPLSDNSAFMRDGIDRLYQTGNELWVAGTFMGISVLKDLQVNAQAQVYFEDFFVSNVYKDNEGNILLCTFDKGVIVIPDIQMPGTINLVKDDPATSIYSDSELGLLFGTTQGVLMGYKDKKATILDDKGTRKIEGMYGDQSSDLVLYANGNIKAYNKKTGQSLLVSELSLKDAVFSSPDAFYLGTNKGVFKVKWDGKTAFKMQPLDGFRQRIYALEYSQKEACLYVSTASGLFRIDSAGISKPIRFNNQDVFPIQLVYHDGIIYASSRKDGILVIQNGQVTNSILPMVNGQTEVVGKFLIYDNSIFASSANGFFRFDMKGNLMTPLHIVYGFSMNKTVDFMFNADQLWVCHSGGVQMIDLNYAASTAAAPTIGFNSVYVNDQRIDDSRTGDFESDQRKIEFVFSAPTLRNRATTYYHYRLVGYDTNWIVNGYAANRAIYNALAAGSYILQVKTENQGRYSGVISYSFSIAKPYYMQYWFMTCCVVLFLVGVYCIYKWQLSIQQRKLRQMNELNASKLTAIQSQMNPHFIFNALNSIQDLVLKGDVENSYSYITTFSNLVRRTLNYSDKDFIDFEQEIKLLELYLSLEKLRFKKFLNYEINHPNINAIQLPPLLIQPFIENALLHGLLHKEGEKKLRIEFVLTDVLICTIEDNGIGRERSKAIKQRQRSEHESFSGKAIHKRFEILSTAFKGNFGYVYEDLYTGDEPTGTRVTLTIPIKHHY